MFEMKVKFVEEELRKLRNYLEENCIAYGFIHSSDGELESIALSIKIDSLPCSMFRYKLAEEIAKRYGVQCYIDCDNWAEDRSPDELEYSIRYGIACSKEEEIEKAVRKLVNAKNDLEKTLEKTSRKLLDQINLRIPSTYL